MSRGGAFAWIAALSIAACDRSRDASHAESSHSTPSLAHPTRGAADGVAEVSSLDAPIERPKPGNRDDAIARAIEGRRLADEGRLNEARTELEGAVTADPACVEARVELGFFLLEELDDAIYGSALEQFRVARLLAPDEPLAACGEGLARQELGDVDRAEPLLRSVSRAMRPRPTRFAIVTAALAQIDAVRGRTDDALRQFQEAADVPGIAPRARAIFLARRADLLLLAGRAAEAEAQVRESIVLDPENLRAHYLLSQALKRRGATEEAAREARVHEALRALADHNSKRIVQDVDRRLRLRRELIAAWPEYRRGAYVLVRELLDCARFDDALRELAELSRRDGTTIEIHGLLARAKAGAGDLAGARASITAMCGTNASVPAAFVRGVLEDWQRGNPAVTPEQMQATLRDWIAR